MDSLIPGTQPDPIGERIARHRESLNDATRHGAHVGASYGAAYAGVNAAIDRAMLRDDWKNVPFHVATWAKQAERMTHLGCGDTVGGHLAMWLWEFEYPGNTATAHMSLLSGVPVELIRLAEAHRKLQVTND